jgi:hypothetical protein
MHEHLHLLETYHQSHLSVLGKSNLRIVLQEENSGILPIKNPVEFLPICNSKDRLDHANEFNCIHLFTKDVNRNLSTNAYVRYVSNERGHTSHLPYHKPPAHIIASTEPIILFTVLTEAKEDSIYCHLKPTK